MTGLDNINKRIYDTYHSKKNKEILPIFIFFGVIVILFKNPLVYEIIVWGIYFLYCSYNNDKLNKDPENLKERQHLLEFKQKILNGELKFKDNHQ